MKKTYTAQSYLAAFEPWLLEDTSAVASMLESDTRLAHAVAHKLLIPIDSDGKYPAEVWQGLHPLYNHRPASLVDCRRLKTAQHNQFT